MTPSEVASPPVRPILFIGLALLSLAAPCAGAGSGAAGRASGGGSDNAAAVVLQGLKLEFSARPVQGSSPVPREGDYVEVEFRVTDAVTGNPVPALAPAAWMDLSRRGDGAGQPLTCKDKVRLSLQGTLNYRPMIDLNSYYLVVLNRDASISVIDPLVGLAGITQLYGNVLLQAPGEDWVKSRDGRRLYVSMPRAGKVAAVDAESFKVAGNIPAGSRPVRVALQPDGKYLWVGDDAGGASESGVAVIDTGDMKAVARIPTGAGHHEIAFSEDGRFAFVSNLEGGTVSVIDVRKMEKVRDVRTGPRPSALAYSPLAGMLYAADAAEGTVSAVDGARHEVIARMEAKPGLNALRFAPGGRFAVALSGTENAAFVVDASANRIAHVLEVGGQPFQVSFTDAFAYIRGLSTEHVTMVPLALFEGGGKPDVKTIAAGVAPPGRSGTIGIADTVVRARQEAAVLVANPADSNVYFYMEGMTAPMGQYRNWGHELKAVEVIDRSIKEKSPGVYSGTVKIPKGGEYDVALFLESPTVVHCFRMAAADSPLMKIPVEPLRLELLGKEPSVKAGETARLRFRLTDPATASPLAGLADVLVRNTLATGQWQERRYAEHAGDGVYEVVLSAPRPGFYYVTVECASLGVRPDQLPLFSLRAEKGGAASDKPSQGPGGEK